MKASKFAVAVILSVSFCAASLAFFRQEAPDPGFPMTDAARTFLATLSDEERAKTVVDYDSDRRVGWHFIPKESRKGLQLRDMNKEQKEAAHQLLRESLSQAGFEKARLVMKLETLLHILEGGGRRFARDPLRYYWTIFGEPKDDGRWGLSVEGHHLSLNFVVENNHIVSTTPTFYGANPATVMSDVPGDHGIEKGTRALADEEQLAFDLLHALDDEQRKDALIAGRAPREIRAAGEAQPPQEKAEGIPYADLNDDQQKLLRQLVSSYAGNLPSYVFFQRLDAIDAAGWDKVHFAWAGARQPGIGHYYKIQGPTFLIEFVNVQPDAAGNPANHIHCVWRDMNGDFAIPIATN